MNYLRYTTSQLQPSNNFQALHTLYNVPVAIPTHAGYEYFIGKEYQVS